MFNDLDVLSLILRWLHIVGAIVAVGGAVFMRFALMPAAKSLPDDVHQTLRAGVLKRFSRLFLIALAVLVITGFANYAMYQMKLHEGRGGGYHMIMGIKILLAFVVFFIGSALTGRAEAFEPIRRKAPLWLLVNIVLALAVVALAGIARQLSLAALAS